MNDLQDHQENSAKTHQNTSQNQCKSIAVTLCKHAYHRNAHKVSDSHTSARDAVVQGQVLGPKELAQHNTHQRNNWADAATINYTPYEQGLCIPTERQEASEKANQKLRGKK